MATDEKPSYVGRVMTLGPAPLLIETVHGVIEIHRVENNGSGRGRSNRQLRIVLPEGTTLCQSPTKMAERSKWFEGEGTERKPRFERLEAVVENGEFHGVRPVRAVRLKVSAT